MSWAQTQFEWQYTTSLVGSRAGAYSGSTIDMSADGTKVIIGAPYLDFNNTTDQGNARLWEETSTGWTPGFEFNYYENIPALNYGGAVSISGSGNTIAIGAPGYENNSGTVEFRAFDDESGVWSYLGISLDGGKVGEAVSLSANGSMVVVGAANYTSGFDYFSGRVQVFYTGTSYQIGQDIVGDAYDRLGASVDISADGLTIIIAGDGGSVGGGTDNAAIYRLVNNQWVQIGDDLQIPANNCKVRVAISPDGTRAAVGAPDCNGGVQLYSIENDNWSLLGSRITGSQGSRFGAALSLSENGGRIAIGANNVSVSPNGSVGRVTVHEFDGSSWVAVGSPIVGTQALGFLGEAVAISGDGMRLAIGEPGYSSQSIPQAGRVQIYGLGSSEANDAPCNAVLLPADGSVQTGFSNRYATIQANEADILPLNIEDCENAWCDTETQAGTQNTVWFKFNAPSSGAVSVSTCDLADFDTQIAVFSAGSCGNFLTFSLKAANDDYDNCPTLDSYLEVDGLTPGALYYIVVDGFNEAVGTFDIAVTPLQPNSTNAEPMDEPSLTAYPNPSTGSFTLACGLAASSAQLQLVDTHGQVVFQQVLQQTSDPLQVKVSDLPQGMYFARLQSREQTATIKVVVNK